jgi:dTDP-4-dehydrorhamnose reductase
MRRWSDDGVAGFSSSDVDIRDPVQVNKILTQSQPAWVILAAAYTDVDGCESHPDLAFSVNRDGAVNVAEAAGRVGARLMFVSTDYVFDGARTSSYETDDARRPVSLYGRSKAEAEARILEILPGCCIVRTSWLFGVHGRCFPNTILNLSASRSQIDVVDDQRGSPTYSTDLADAIIGLCRLEATGIVHATNSGDCTWFDFAQEIVRQAGLPTEVRPTTTEKMARPAKRPAYSVLSPASLHAYGIHMPPWQDALRRFLEERKLG